MPKKVMSIKKYELESENKFNNIVNTLGNFRFWELKRFTCDGAGGLQQRF